MLTRLKNKVRGLVHKSKKELTFAETKLNTVIGPIKVKLLPGATIPKYMTDGSAGIDLVAHNFIALYDGQEEKNIARITQNTVKSNKGYVTLRHGERLLVGTGLFMEIPEGYELQVRDRSGNSLKKGLKVFNSPGTIDSDYRGEIGVILWNTNMHSMLRIELGERIAQGIFLQIERPDFFDSTDISTTSRGEGGFGHTGSK